MSGTFNFRLLFSVSILLFGIILSAQETAKDFEGRQSLSDFGSEVPEKMLEASSVDMIIINDSKIALDGGFFGDDVVIPYIIMSALRSRRAPILINGSLASIVLKCATQPDEFESKSNGVKILSHFFKNFKFDRWNFYISRSPDPFVLFVPLSYIETHKETGLDFSGKELFSTESAAAVIQFLDGFQCSSHKVSAGMLKFFKDYNSEVPLLWNIVFFGHGYAADFDRVSVSRLFLKGTRAMIAGIPANQFIKFFGNLGMKIKLNTTTLFTCFGGGLNAQALEFMISLSQLKNNFNPGVILSVASGDSPIRTSVCLKKGIDIKAIFDMLDSINIFKSSVDEARVALGEVIIKSHFCLADSAGLLFYPNGGVFSPLNLMVKGLSGENVYNITSGTADISLTDIDPARDRIRLLAPGELGEQTIKQIKTTNIGIFLIDSVFQANRDNAFFKILNIEELSGTISSEYMHYFLGMRGNSKIINLYDVKVVLFPAGVGCAGYVMFATSNTYPRKIYLWKAVDPSRFDLFFVKESPEIENKNKFDVTAMKWQQQIISNGLLLKSFSEKMSKFGDGASIVDSIFSGVFIDGGLFSEILDNYEIPQHVLPDDDGFAGLLYYIMQNCDEMTLFRFSSIKNGRQILNQMHSIDKSVIGKFLEGKACAQSNIFRVPLAALDHSGLTQEGIEEIKSGLLEDTFLGKNVLSLYDDFMIELLERESFSPEFIEALARAAEDDKNIKIIDYLITHFPEVALARPSIQELFFAGKLLGAEYREVLTDLIEHPEKFKDESRRSFVLYEPIASARLKRLIDALSTAFPSLTVLCLSAVGITELPENISCLNLVNLFLDGNRLTTLPCSMGKLKNLHCLSCSRNEISTLPTELAQMDSLRLLVLDSNRLRELPPSIVDMKNLRLLRLAGNPSLVISDDMMKKLEEKGVKILLK